jgi:hypothetical protein
MERTERFDIANPRVTIENTAGSIDIDESTDGAVTVTVASGNDKMVEQTTIKAAHDHVTVHVPNPSRFRTHPVAVRLSVPPTAVVNVATVTADVTTRGRLQRLTVGAVNGDITVGTVSGGAELRSVSGDISVERSPAGTSVTTTSGHVRVGEFAGPCRVKSVSGDCTMRAVGGGDLDASTVSGDVTVLVDPGIVVDVTVQSLSGDLSSEIPLDGEGTGEPGPYLVIASKTLSGDVRIRRSEVPA